MDGITHQAMAIMATANPTPRKTGTTVPILPAITLMCRSAIPGGKRFRLTDRDRAGEWTTAAGHELVLADRHEPVGQRLHEADDRILLCVRQAQAPNSARVHVVGRLRRRPAYRTFTDVMGLAAWQDVASVVEMHDRLQAREISVVPVGLHEGRIGPLVHIAQCRHLNSRLIVWRQLEPSLIHRRGLAEQMPLGEKTADAAIDE